MRKLTILFLILFACSSVNAQGCLPEGITFTTQAEIDNFQTNNPGCTEIEGFLYVYGGQSTITNLNGLNVITSVGDYLTIYDADITSLSGLSSLVGIGGRFEISECSSLTSLAGLEALSEVGGDVSIASNDNLLNFSGINALQTIGGALYVGNNISLVSISDMATLSTVQGNFEITGNNSLSNLDGLQGIPSFPANVDITSNSQLVSISALSNVTYIGGRLAINLNAALTSLSGLESLNTVGGGFQMGVNNLLVDISALGALSSVGGSFAINSNSSLSSIADLSSLTHIAGDLMIEYNAQLGSLNGLDNINPNSIISLLIENNPFLSECEVKSVCDYLAAPNGAIWIFGNATGCSSKEEVEAACLVGFENPTVQSSSASWRIKVQSYPNPFPGFTTIEYELEHSATVNLLIYNHLGQCVAVLVDGDQVAGRQQVQWEAEGLPSGIFFYRLTAGSQSSTGKMVVVR